MGIDSSQVPALKQLFHVDAPQLFEPEMPRHSVTIESFYMDKYLVTNAQFKRFVDQNPQWQPQNIREDFHNGNYLKQWNARGYPPEKADHPVVNVSWYAAAAYCQWAGKRLPTEAEFEHAARGGLTALYPWGDQPVDKTRANYSGSDIGTTTPVGHYPANGYGLFDMAGNVWEFLADEWQPYRPNPRENPVAGGDLFTDGQSFLRVKTRRVIRGGSWGGAPINLWVEYRDSHPPADARDFVGFRCAAPVPPSPK
jgi:formylglycine-generating enzyme